MVSLLDSPTGLYPLGLPTGLHLLGFYRLAFHHFFCLQLGLPAVLTPISAVDGHRRNTVLWRRGNRRHMHSRRPSFASPASPASVPAWHGAFPVSLPAFRSPRHHLRRPMLREGDNHCLSCERPPRLASLRTLPLLRRRCGISRCGLSRCGLSRCGICPFGGGGARADGVTLGW